MAKLISKTYGDALFEVAAEENKLESHLKEVEAVLDGHGIFYDRSETWIESEKLYEVLYSFEMEVANNG